MRNLTKLKPTHLNHRVHQGLGLPYRLNATVHPGPKPTVVLLHGLASSQQIWNEVVKVLNVDCKVVTVDLLGFGRSPKPGNIRYTPDDHVRSLRWTLLSRGITGPVVLVGHSMGALLAVHYAARYPSQIRRLILCSMPLYNGDLSSRKVLTSLIENSTNLYLRAYRQVRRSPQAAMAGARLINRLLPGDQSIALTDATWYSFCQSLEHTIERQTTTAELAKIRVPIDLIYGQFDGLVIHPYLTSLAARRPEVTYQTLPVGHQLTRSFAKAIRARLQPELAT